MKFVKANGLVIHYLDQGRRDGRPIVFINALGCDLRIWTEVAGILAPEFRVLTYDKRGHGLSESGPDKCEMADYAADLMGLLDSVGARAGYDRRTFYRRRDRAAVLSPTPRPRRRVRPLRHCGENRNGRVLGSAHRPGRARRRRGGRRLRPQGVVHRRLPSSAIRRVHRHPRDADANAAIRLSRCLRRLEARGPSALCRADRGALLMPGRR